MTSRPRLKLGRHLLPGLAAVALFVVFAVAFLAANFPAPEGFGEGSITASIGYAMFDLTDLAAHPVEGFLVSFITIAIVLDAALDGAVMLAKREDEGATPLSSPEDESVDTDDEPAGSGQVTTDGGEVSE